MAECSKNLIGEVVMSGAGMKLDVLTFVMFQAPCSLVPLLISVALSWEHEVLVAFQAHWPIILLNALNAFALNLIIATTLKRLSAVAFVIIGIVKDTVIVSTSSMVFGDHISPQQQVGFAVIMTGIACWSHMKIQEQQEAAKLKETEPILGSREMRVANANREKISTETAARYILRNLNIDETTAKVLFLPCSPFDNFPSYLTASVFHGMVSLLDDRVVDVPEYVYAYRYDHGGDVEEDLKLRSNIWGQGFTLGFKLPQRPHLDRENISQRIYQREFDLIIFGRMSAYEPCNFYSPFGDRDHAVPQFYEEVTRTYPKERVALLYGDDSGIDDPVIRTQLYRFLVECQ
eukprot:symbB.v1.2.028478.t1/scaffold3023.1/size65105/3